MRQLLIWASGYSQHLLDAYQASAADRRILQKIGASLLFSCIWFTLMTMTAAWVISFEAPTHARILAAGIAGVIACLFVLVFDRGFVFGIDTSPGSRMKAFWYGSFRVGIVVAIASLVDVAVMPIVMGPELRMEAATMREQAEQERFTSVQRSYDVSGLRTEMTDARNEVGAARQALATLPDPIAAELARAERCLTSLPGRPYARREPATYSAMRRRCFVMRQEARARRAEYVSAAEARVAAAEANLTTSRSTYHDTREAVRTRLDAAAADDDEIYSTANFSVFINLVTTQVSAATKAFLLLVVHLVLDLLPFILKGYFGRTDVGARIRVERQRAILRTEADLEAARADHLVQVESVLASAAAARSALSRPSMVRFMEDMAEDEMRTVEPLDQAATAMRRVVSAEAEMRRIHVHTPGLRTLKMELWSRAVARSLNAAAVRG